MNWKRSKLLLWVIILTVQPVADAWQQHQTMINQPPSSIRSSTSLLMSINPATTTRLWQVLPVALLIASPSFALEEPAPTPPVPVLVPPDPIVRETKRVQKVRKLEDERRLKSCADKGDQWEHCFFYGDGDDETTSDNRLVPPSRTQGVPTW